MLFSELNNTTQEEIIDLLNNHIAASSDILKEDHCLIPMLMIPDLKQLLSLQSKDGTIDVDRAYATVIETLKNCNFTYALFSYTTKIKLDSNKITNALKTYIYTKDRIEVSFFTPFEIKGLFKKTINIEKTILIEIKENIF